MKKKLLSILLTLSMTVGVLPVTAFAENDHTFIFDDNVTQETSDYFEETQTGIISDGTEYIVTDVIYETDNLFDIKYHSDSDCFISAIMTDDITREIVSQKTIPVSYEAEEVELELDTEQISEYYTVKAVLSDGENNLCEVYVYEEKSFAWHELMSLDINDTRLQNETIVDFGKSYTDDSENFAIVNDEVIVLTVDTIGDVDIEEGDEEAALFSIGTTVDESYTIKRSDVDGEINNIKKGDKVLILPKDNAYDAKTFIVDDMDTDKVSLFDSSDDEITLTTDQEMETTVEDYFDLIRIDTYIEATEEDMIPNTNDETLVWEDDEQAQLFADFNIVDKGAEKSKTFSKSFAGGKLSDTLTAKAGVHLTVTAVVGINCKWKGPIPYNIDISLTFKIKAEASLDVTNVFGVKLSKNASISGEPEVGKIPIASIGVANISIPVNIVYSFSAGASVNFTTTQTAGMSISFNYNGSSGSFNKSTKTPIKCTLKIGHKIAIMV